MLLTALLFAWAGGRGWSAVSVDVNQPDHLKLRFEQVVVLVGDPASRVTIPLGLQMPGVPPLWSGLEFGALSIAETGYRASVTSGNGGSIALAEFRVADAGFNPLASLPISGQSVLAQTWQSVAGTIPAGGSVPELNYIWNVNQSVGAGFGMFGTLEVFAVPEPGTATLVAVGMVASALVRWRMTWRG